MEQVIFLLASSESFPGFSSNALRLSIETKASRILIKNIDFIFCIIISFFKLDLFIDISTDSIK